MTDRTFTFVVTLTVGVPDEPSVTDAVLVGRLVDWLYEVTRRDIPDCDVVIAPSLIT